MTKYEAKQVAKDRKAARQAKWAERRIAQLTAEGIVTTWRGPSHFVRTASAYRDTNPAR